MNQQRNGTDMQRQALAIGIWENEGGAPARDSMDSHYGRRIETDGSWSIYHVFTGVTAAIGGRVMIGLNRSGATEGMMSLNLRNEGRRRERNRSIVLAPTHREIDEVPS